jgi:hypothetical protein
LYTRLRNEEFLLNVDESLFNLFPHVCNKCNEEHTASTTTRRANGIPSSRPSPIIEVLDDDDDDTSCSSMPHSKKQCLAALPAPLDDTPHSVTLPTPALSAAETADLVKTFLAIDEARSRTRTMIATVQKFLSLRATLTEALAPVAADALDVDDFMLMQESFVQMLCAQLEAIKNDQRVYADKLALANKSNEES